MVCVCVCVCVRVRVCVCVCVSVYFRCKGFSVFIFIFSTFWTIHKLISNESLNTISLIGSQWYFSLKDFFANTVICSSYRRGKLSSLMSKSQRKQGPLTLKKKKMPWMMRLVQPKKTAWSLWIRIWHIRDIRWNLFSNKINKRREKKKTEKRSYTLVTLTTSSKLEFYSPLSLLESGE